MDGMMVFEEVKLMWLFGWAKQGKRCNMLMLMLFFLYFFPLFVDVSA